MKPFPFHMGQPFLIAHRGERGQAPENTMAAFERAAQSPHSPMLELDVQLSRDRIPIVLHDAELDRTTDGHGPANQMSLEELKGLDAGSWYSARFSGERIPTLKEVLEGLGERILINVEIKHDAYEEGEPSDSAAKQAGTMVLELGLVERVIFSSFDARILFELRRLSEDFHLAFLSEEPLSEKQVEWMRGFGACCYNQDQALVNAGELRRLKELGLACLSYTVNDPIRAQELFRMGVEGLFTDYPERLAPILKEFRKG